jgi:uncharacterized protein YsxB (DUF464 family)
MIYVNIKEDKEKHVKEILISGHANSKLNTNGNDLVCAAVSGITYGILNSLNDKKLDVSINEGFVNIKVNLYDLENERALRILINSLKTIEDKNKKNITIKKGAI